MTDQEQLSDIEIRSEEVQEILTRPPHFLIQWGNLIFLLLILLFTSLSWVIKYPDIILSEAEITTAVPPQQVFANVSGQLQAFLVSNNETVKPDQALAIIENTADFKDVYRLKAAIDTTSINQLTIDFPIDQLQSLAIGEIELAYAAFENSYLQHYVHRKFQPLDNEATTNQLILEELKARLISMEYQKELNISELAYQQKDMDRSQTLFEQGTISEQAFERKKLSYLNAQKSFENLKISISQLRLAISNSEKTSRVIEINKAEKELTLMRKVIQSFNQLKKAIYQWEMQYVLKSKSHGQISFHEHWHKNQTISKGDMIFTIVPAENSSFMAKIRTPSRNSGKLKVGQKVSIKLENYPEEEFGALTAYVSTISKIPNQEGHYLIDAKLPEKLITTYNKELAFRYNMKGSAEIITEDSRLIERFFRSVKGRF